MADPEIPHFKIPLVFDASTGKYQLVEQDTTDEITQCVINILSTEKGTRDDLPDFGITDPTFRQGGPDMAEIEEAILTYEPRVEVLLEENPDALDELIRYVKVQLENRGSNG